MTAHFEKRKVLPIFSFAHVFNEGKHIDPQESLKKQTREIKL